MNTHLKPLIVVQGPTASGKTVVAIEIARQFNTEIISADARQVFVEMQIGTARPTEAELNTVPHHLIGHRHISENYSAGIYADEALRAITDVQNRTGMAILCGGSGLYVKAVCEGLDDFPTVDPNVRKRLQEMQENENTSALYQLLEQKDPAYAARVDAENPRRIIRALEICLSSNEPYSSFLSAGPKHRPFESLYIALQEDRSSLYHRINARVDSMLEQGLEQEARSLHPLRGLPALETVGYAEFFDFFENKISREKAVELIKRNSRRYAKRQMTWLRSKPEVHWFKATQVHQMIAFIKKQVNSII